MRPLDFHNSDQNFIRPWQVPAAYPARRRFGQFSNRRDQVGPQYTDDFWVQGITTSALNKGTGTVGGASSFDRFEMERNCILEVHAINAFEFPTGNSVFVPPAPPDPQSTQPQNTNANGGCGVTLQISDSLSSRNLFSKPVFMNAIMGSGIGSHILPIPRRFGPQSSVTTGVTMESSLGATRTWYIALIGRKTFSKSFTQDMVIPYSWEGADGKLYAEDYYAYVFYFGTVNQGATPSVDVLIEPDSDFEWYTTTGAMFAGANLPNSSQFDACDIAVQLTDTRSQRNFFSAAVRSWLMSGSGSQIFVNPQPRIFEAQSKLTMSLTSGAGSNAINGLSFVLEGRKIFELDP